MQKAAPEVIVHQMTSLGITKDFRRFDQEFAVTNELRTRAVLLLHDVFGHEHKEIAEITGTSAANSRQILARARRHVDKGNPRFEASRARREEVARRFFAAADGGDLDGLLRALAPDVVYYGDGGGEARAVVGFPHGRDRVARFLAGLFRRFRKFEAASES